MMPEENIDSNAEPSDRTVAPAEVTLAAVWTAVKDLANGWASLPKVRRFAAELPRNASQRMTGIPGLLQEMQAGGGDISGYPTRIIPAIQLMLHFPLISNRVLPQGWGAWLELAQHVEAAHRLTVAWLRSHLPGYPNLPAPQLAAGTPLTTNEFTDQLIWLEQERKHGFKFPDPPAQIGSLLDATLEQWHEIEQGTRAVADAFKRTDEWLRFTDATAALTDFGRTDLREASEVLAQKLKNSEIDQYSRLVRPRFNYRVRVLEQVLDGLHGSAMEYAKAFSGINRLVELAASEVFGELAIYGQPTVLSCVEDIDLRPGTYQLASFTRTDNGAENFDLLEIGQIVWLDDLLVRDAVRLTGATTSFDGIGATERWTGLVLPETSSAW